MRTMKLVAVSITIGGMLWCYATKDTNGILFFGMLSIINTISLFAPDKDKAK